MNKLSLLFFLGMASLFGCQQFDDLEDIEYVGSEAEYAVPLIDSRLSIEELLQQVEEGTTILVDPNGQLRFVYEGDVISQTSDDIFASINASLPPVIPVTSSRMPLPITTPDGMSIDRIELKGGQLIYFFENQNPLPLQVQISFPQLLKKGKPLVFRQSIPAFSGSGTPPRLTNFLLPESLAGYTILPQNDTIYVEYQALGSDGKSYPLNSVLLRIQELRFAYAEGYLGNQVYKGGRDTIDIDFFENWIRGDVYFEEPTVTFDIENSFGVPTRSIVNQFNVINVKGQVLPLQSELVTKGIDFPYPSMNEVGKTVRSNFVFNKQNSNIDVLLGSGPIAVDYDVDALTNPDKNTAIQGFITDSSYYRVRVKVDLPLFGRVSDFVARDTYDIDLSDFSGVDYAEFKLVADNELPLAVDLQGYFLDEQGNVLDSLLDSRQRVVAAAPVNSQGLATEPIQQVTKAPYPEPRFNRIRNARYLAISTSFSTSGNGATSVRPLADQELRVRIGAILGVKRD